MKSTLACSGGGITERPFVRRYKGGLLGQMWGLFGAERHHSIIDSAECEARAKYRPPSGTACCCLRHAFLPELSFAVSLFLHC